MKQKIRKLCNESIYQDKIIFFDKLANRLLCSHLLVVLKFVDHPFPPSIEDCELIFKNLFGNTENDIEESFPDRVAIGQGYGDYADSFISGNDDEFIDIDVEVIDTFTELIEKCLIIRDWYRVLSIIENDHFLRRAERYGIMTACKSYELLGYWTVKMKEKKRNIEKAGLTKRKNKLKNVESIDKLKQDYDLSDKAQKTKFMSEAIKITGVTNTRSIENYLKMIADKK